MPQTLKFEICFTGWQAPRIDDDGAFIRPASAEEIARAIADDINHKLEQSQQRKFKVTVKPLH
jgi:hypothetical protein